MGVKDWSTTAASNTDVDGTTATDIAENNRPRTVNNALRNLIADLATFRDIIGGLKVSAGTADAQTLTTGLSLTAHTQGILLAFEAGSGLTNTGAMTINVDAIGAKSVKTLDGADPPAGAVTAGGIYFIAYEAGADVYLLLNPAAVTLPTAPQFTTIELGHASDTTLARVSAGVVSIEGVAILTLAGGTLSGELNFADNLATRPLIKDYAESVNALGSIGGGTQDIDLTAGNVVTGTVDTSTTTFTFSNPPASGRAGSFTLILTNGGSQTVNWPAAVNWAGGTAPTLTAAGVDLLTFVTVDGGTTWYGFAAGLDMS